MCRAAPQPSARVGQPLASVGGSPEAAKALATVWVALRWRLMAPSTARPLMPTNSARRAALMPMDA